MTNLFLVLIAIGAALCAGVYMWLRHRERREMQSWNDDHENWPDETTKGMD